MDFLWGFVSRDTLRKEDLCETLEKPLSLGRYISGPALGMRMGEGRSQAPAAGHEDGGAALRSEALWVHHTGILPLQKIKRGHR